MSWLIRLIINSTCQKNLWSDFLRRLRSSGLSEKTTSVVKFICYMSLQSQFVYRSKAIAKLYTFDSSKYSTKTETQTYAEKLVWNTPSVSGANSQQYICYFHNYQTHCTNCYKEATVNRLSMMRITILFVKYSLENNHFISSQN